MPPAALTGRDLRLDFFRGLSLWFIFLDHIPSNRLSWLTIRNYGFSDAAEIFVFISGFTAAFVYGRVMLDRGFVVASARILKRVWQLYVAFVFLSVIYIAQTAYVAHHFDNPLFADEMVVLHFLQRPEIILVEVLRLRFLLANVNILPLYILLMLVLPIMLWLILRSPPLAFAFSLAIWSAAYFGGLNLKLYPVEQDWFFNPFAWQLLFFLGAWCAVGGATWVRPLYQSNTVFAICVVYLLLAFALSITRVFPESVRLLPEWLLIFPLDKSGLSPLRLAHFLALTILVVRFVPRDAAFLRTPWAQPVIMCGRHSLEIFCLGVFLSLMGGFLLIEVSGTLAMQVAVSLFGLAIMVGLAALMSWYKSLDRRVPKQPATR
ncbi:MAG: OpgC domain-containing protein [Xanthobacteraceae bacterium]